MRIPKYIIPGIAWFFIVTILLLMPGSDLPKAQTWLSRIYFDKWVHAGLFAIFSFLIVYPLYKRGKKNSDTLIRNLIITLVLYAFLSEVGQYLMHAGRDADPWDFLADTAGIVLGSVIAGKLTRCNIPWLEKIFSKVGL